MTIHSPAVYRAAGRLFFKEHHNMREAHRPFWQELWDELSPRRNAAGWACVLAILVMFGIVGALENPADSGTRADVIVSR